MYANHLSHNSAGDAPTTQQQLNLSIH